MSSDKYEKRIAELERRNALLRKVALASKNYWDHRDAMYELNGSREGKYVNWQSLEEREGELEMNVRNSLDKLGRDILHPTDDAVSVRR